MMSCWPGDKTASFMTTSTTKVFEQSPPTTAVLGISVLRVRREAAYACGTAEGEGLVCERPAGRGSRVREVQRLYATDGKVSDEQRTTIC